MIVKKIQAKTIRSKATYVFKLTDYMLRLEGKSEGESLLYSGGIGFLDDDQRSMQSEMASLASESPRSANPIVHWILSWKEDEQPTSMQVEVAVEILLRALGLVGHQCIWAVHEDTHNLHCHIAINRVHPDSGQVISPAGGFDIDAAHRAIAMIETLQGWQSEPNAIYSTDKAGLLVRNKSRVNSSRTLSPGARDAERWTGMVSSQRQAIEVAATLIRAAKSWKELHDALGAHGMAYKTVGSGAVLEIGGTTVKASSAGRDCSFYRLVKRFGVFQHSLSPNSTPLETKKNLQNEIAAELIEAYELAKRERKSKIRSEQLFLLIQHSEQSKALVARQKDERNELRKRRAAGELSRSEWRIKRSLQAAKHASEKAWLSDMKKKELAEIKTNIPILGDFEFWLRQSGKDEMADELRYQDCPQPMFWGKTSSNKRLIDIRDFRASAILGEIHYSKNNSNGVNVTSFIDTGSTINLMSQNDKASILAAMQLAKEKWGQFEVEGSPEFKQICVELAAEHGFKFADEILASRVDVRKNEIKVARAKLQGNSSIKNLMRELIKGDGNSYQITATKRIPNANLHIHERLHIRREEMVGAANDSVVQKLNKVREWANAGYSLTQAHGADVRTDIEPINKESNVDSNVIWSEMNCETAYLRCQEIQWSTLANQKKDVSRVDAEIALKLVKLGFNTLEIEEALLKNAEKIHPSNVKRDWKKYAKRVLAYAISHANLHERLDSAPPI